VLLLLILGACTAEGEDASRSEARSGGIAVEARTDVLVMLTPLGDVAVGSVEAGATATAVCRISRAISTTGVEAGAVRIAAGDLVGYAPVEVLSRDPAERRPTFDRDERALTELLPVCSRR
jgi:hypothetical protein